MSAKNLIFSSAGNVEVNPNAWDISKAVYDDGPDAGDVSKAYKYNAPVNVTTKTADPKAIYIKPDGLTFYFAGAGRIYQYTMSTPWNFGTATDPGISFLHNAQVGVAEGLFFKSDGTKMYIVGVVSVGLVPLVFQYSLATAWNVSTASYDSISFNVGAQEDQPRGLFFKPDGTKMYITGVTSDRVYEYSLSSAWSISSASSSGNKLISAQETNPSGVSFLEDGLTMYVIGTTGDDVNEYTLSTPWDVTTASFVQAFLTNTTDPQDIFFKPDGSMFFVPDAAAGSSGILSQFVIGGFPTVSQTNPQGLFFRPDGTKMYIIDSQFDNVKEHGLSVAWDITTATVLATKSISAQELTPSDLFFKSDGTKMYVIGSTGDDVNEYVLSTPWDVSTASFTTNFSISAQETAPNTLFFKPDGTKMYVLGQTNDTIYQYSLSTAWDISTTSYDSISFSVASQETTPRGLFFKPDGSKMYVVGSTGDDINEYNLSTLWNITSASFSQSFGVLDTAPSDIYFRNDGAEFFIMANIANRVIKYTIPSS